MPNDSFSQPMPFAVRPKLGAFLAGMSLAEFYKHLSAGRYETFLDGTKRMIVTQSIINDQKRLAREQAGTPATRPSKRYPARKKPPS